MFSSASSFSPHCWHAVPQVDAETIAKTDALPLLEVELRLVVPDLVWVPDLAAPAPVVIPEGQVCSWLDSPCCCSSACWLPPYTMLRALLQAVHHSCRLRQLLHLLRVTIPNASKPFPGCTADWELTGRRVLMHPAGMHLSG